MSIQESVVICGGGVAGLALGIRLRQQGLDPLVIERDSNVRPQIKGEYFQPQGVALLREMGLLDDLEAQGAVRIFRVSHAYRHPLTRRELKFICSYSRQPRDRFGLSLLHEDIVVAMRRRYAELGGRLQSGVFVRKMVQRSQSVELELSEGSWISAQFFVGADGRHSLTRKLAGLQPVEQPCERMMLAGLFENIKLRPDEFYTEQTRHGVLYAFRSNHGDTRVYLCLTKASFEEARKNLQFLMLSEVRESCLSGRRHAVLKGLASVMPTVDSVLSQAHLGRAVWFGDAAGTVDPLRGHGMSVALNDAKRLTGVLERALSEDASSHLIWEKEISQWESLWRDDYLHARFIGQWIGRLFMEKGTLTRWAKWRAIGRYQKDPALMKYLVELFGGLSKEPFAIYDVLYLLGLIPTAVRRQLQRTPLGNRWVGLQNKILTTPPHLFFQLLAKTSAFSETKSSREASLSSSPAR